MLSLAVLAVLAAGLLLLRYRFDNRLELRHPALAALQQLLPVAQTEVAKLKRQFEMSAEERRGGDRETEGGGARDSSDFNPSGVEQSDNKDGEPGGVELAEKVENPETGSEEGWAENQGPDEDEQASGRNASSTRDESRAQKQEVQASGPKAEQPGNSSSLLAKVSDTLANLVSALKSKPNDAQRGKGEQTAKSGNSQRDVKSDRSSRGDAQGSAARSADGSGDPSQPDGGTSVHPDPNGSPRGGSGAGPDDGSKTVNLAEQLEAMGKISIILGKRSENITGRADLEATSGRPELKTGYEARQAEHRKVAATAQRDQIPIEFENYVQQYFGELRKAGARAGRAPKRH
jgi:hypothetical protein